MKSVYITFLVLIGSISLSNAQVLEIKKVKPEVIKEATERVANYIAEHTSFSVENRKTKKLYKTTKNLPVSGDYIVKSRFNQWEYWNGVILHGFCEMGDLFGSQYSDYSKKAADFIFDNDDYFYKQYKARVGCGIYQKYSMHILDHCGAMGAGLLEVKKRYPKIGIDSYTKKAANHILNKELRLNDGTLCRVKPQKMTVWADDLYMSVPFLVKYWQATGEEKYLDEAIKQVELFYKHLWNNETGLYYHCWYENLQRNGVAHWGRCNGWLILAQTELLEALPHDSKHRTKLLNLLEQQILGVIKYQAPSGLWHQLIDRPDTYEETSCTAMFAYAIAKAVNKGWINKNYSEVAFSAWRGIMSRIRKDGQVEGTSQGTGISTSPVYYAKRATPLNDSHGLGAILLAGTELYRLCK